MESATAASLQSPASTVLAIILGAHKWEYMPTLQESNSFALSAAAFERYLRDSAGLNLPSSCIKNLFDSRETAQDIDIEIREFIKTHYVNDTPNFTDLIIYYTGHGDFTRTGQQFQVILRSTRQENLDYSGYTMRQIASTINAVARKARKLGVLDCCYAAAAFTDWQMQSVNDVQTSIERQAAEAFKDNPEISGTALMCACNASEWAIFKDDEMTLFSTGLVQALTEGSEECGASLSIGDVYKLTRDVILNRGDDIGVAPVLHVPKGYEEELTSYGLFPNPARRADISQRRVTALEEKIEGIRDQITSQTTTLDDLRSSVDRELRDIRSALSSQADDVVALKNELVSAVERAEQASNSHPSGLESEYEVSTEVLETCPDNVRRDYFVWRQALSNGLILQIAAIGTLVIVAGALVLALQNSDLSPILKRGALAISDSFAIGFALLFGFSAWKNRNSPDSYKSSSSPISEPPSQRQQWEYDPILSRVQAEVLLDFLGWPVSRRAFVISGLVTLLTACMTGYSLYVLTLFWTNELY